MSECSPSSTGPRESWKLPLVDGERLYVCRGDRHVFKGLGEGGREGEWGR